MSKTAAHPAVSFLGKNPATICIRISISWKTFSKETLNGLEVSVLKRNILFNIEWLRSIPSVGVNLAFKITGYMFNQGGLVIGES
jgi:hypothetical protein